MWPWFLSPPTPRENPLPLVFLEARRMGHRGQIYPGRSPSTPSAAEKPISEGAATLFTSRSLCSKCVPSSSLQVPDEGGLSFNTNHLSPG